MTITVLATPSKIEPEREIKLAKRRDRSPLISIDMATSPQVHARGAAVTGNNGAGGRGRRTGSRLGLNNRAELGGDESGGDGDGRQVNGGKAAGRTKRKAGPFHEDIGGFQFTRITNKKPRTSIEAIPEDSVDATSSHQQKSPKKGRSSKKRVQQVQQPEERTTESTAEAERLTTTDSAATTTTAAAASSKGQAQRDTNTMTSTAPPTETQQGPESGSSPSGSMARSAARKRDHHPSPPEALAGEKKRKKGRPAKAKAAEEENVFESPDAQQTGTTKVVALPSSDTPVNKRNKEMREGKSSKAPKRRSSLGMRGRRASSLIDSGTSNALPHKEVNTKDFYKHIAGDGLSEPRRMRQLLIWCGTRALGEKPSGSQSEDESARLAARVIQEELLKDFTNISELSDWFGREDTKPPAVVVKKPHPKNVQNAGKIKELEEQIQRLQRERHALNSLLKPPSIPRIKTPAQSGTISASTSTSTDRSLSRRTGSEKIDKTVLDASQQAVFSLLEPATSQRQQQQQQQKQQKQQEQAMDVDAEQPNTMPTTTHLSPLPASAISSRLSHIRSNLTPTLDAFAAGIQDVELYRSTADRISSQILGICSRRLEERDVQNSVRGLAIEGGEGGEEGKEEKGDERRRRGGQHQDLGVILGALSRVERR